MGNGRKKRRVRTALARLVGGVAMIAGMASAALADEAIKLEMSAQDAGHLTVAAGANGELSVREAQIAIGLQLSAQADPERGLRLLTSQLYLKQAGREAGSTQLPATATGARTFAHSSELTFAVDPLGPVARSAVALCSRTVLPDLPTQAGVRLDMSVPVVWRVSAGHLDFAGLALSGISASDEVLASPGYYTDAETVEREAAARVEVRCENLVGKSKFASGHGGRVPKAESAAKAAAQDPKADKVAFRSDEPVSAERIQLVCEGGMVRARSGTESQVCLCPGNTVRRQTGANAFACQRRFARRR